MRPRAGIVRCLRAQAGFTLTEMLAAVLVISLFGTAITVGLGAGLKEYRAATFVGESQVLAAQLDDAMGDTFRSLVTVRDASQASGYTYQTSFLGHTLKAPSVAAETSNGRSVLDITGTEAGASASYHLLNGGAYTDCEAKNVTFAIDPTVAVADEYGTAGKVASKVTVSFDVVRVDDPSLTRHYEYTYVPVLGTKTAV